MLSGENIKVTAIIAAGGSGVRMNAEIPKQYIHIHNKPIIIHTLEKFAGCEGVHKIFLVVPENELEETVLLIEKWNITKPTKVVAGGETRQHSVWNGLNSIPENTDIVIVHDGVRPFISEEIITACIEETHKWGAVITAVPVTDTVKEVINHTVRRTLERSKLWRVQTPQGFKKGLLTEAYKKAWETNQRATDDSALVENMGQTVRVIRGEEKNIKITSPEDLIIAEKLLEDV